MIPRRTCHKGRAAFASSCWVLIPFEMGLIKISTGSPMPRMTRPLLQRANGRLRVFDCLFSWLGIALVRRTFFGGAVRGHRKHTKHYRLTKRLPAIKNRSGQSAQCVMPIRGVAVISTGASSPSPRTCRAQWSNPHRRTEDHARSISHAAPGVPTARLTCGISRASDRRAVSGIREDPGAIAPAHSLLACPGETDESAGVSVFSVTRVSSCELRQVFVSPLRSIQLIL